jgi:exosome complex protein LRP1
MPSADTKQVIELVDDLEDNLDELEKNISSLLNTSLSATSRKLPLLDRAKLNVLVVYSIESLVFSYLKLNGIQVKDHAVFKEITRVKQYFAKIKAAEEAPQIAAEKPTTVLNKDAAGRFIKHALVRVA